VRVLEAALSEAATAFVLAVRDTLVGLRRLMRRHVIVRDVRGLLGGRMTRMALAGAERPGREAEEERPQDEGTQRARRS